MKNIIVVGAGTAGMACAITAAERGAQVVVVEKADGVGGTLHIAGGNMSAAGTRRQREHGIVDSAESHFQDVMRMSRGVADPVLLRLAVEEAAATIDWLDDLGFPFASDTPGIYFGHEAYPVARTYWGPQETSKGVPQAVTILATMRPLWDDLVASGKIELLLSHKLCDLVVDDDAVVVGIRVESPTGDVRELRAPAIVLATGGYGSNPELFYELTPGTSGLVTLSRETSTGDGLIAARSVGAAVHNGHLHVAMPAAFETEPGSGRALPGKPHLAPQYRRPRELHVDARGRRFRAEDDASADDLEHAVMALPGQQFWLVFDEEALTSGESFHSIWDESEIRQRAADGQILWMADDLETLARKASLDPGGLAETVAAWNEATRTGHDALGRKDLKHAVETPPFYAALIHAAPTCTAGGVVVDGELRVLDEGGNPIAGLYAAGEILGTGAMMGSAKCAGMAVTPALSLGRILGRQLASVGVGDDMLESSSHAANTQQRA